MIAAWVVAGLACTAGEKAPVDGDSAGSPDPHTGLVLSQIADDADGYVRHPMTYAWTGQVYVSADGTTMSGEATQGFSIDGETICDLRVSLVGSALSGTCAGCTFAFDVDAALVEDGGTADCELEPYVIFLETEDWVDPRLVYWPEYMVEPWGAYFDNVVVTGLSYVRPYTGVITDPYYNTIAFDDWFGPVEYSDRTLTWNMLNEDHYNTLAEYAYCGTAERSRAREPYGGTMVEGQVTCNPAYTDGWTLEATAGETVWVTVDAYNSDAYFEPYFFVNGPDGCAVLTAVGNYPCSGLGFDYDSCPSGSFIAEEDGVYTIWMNSTGYSCPTDETADYRLYVRSGLETTAGG